MSSIFKRACSVKVPGIQSESDYQQSKTRQNAYVKVTGGGLSLPLNEETFDAIYANSTGKPTVVLNDVSVKISGEEKFLRRASISFTIIITKIL